MNLREIVNQNKKEAALKVLTYSMYYLGLFTFALKKTDKKITASIHELLNDEEKTNALLKCYLESETQIPKMEPCITPLIEEPLYDSYELSWSVIPLILIGIELLIRACIVPGFKLAFAEDETGAPFPIQQVDSESAALLRQPAADIGSSPHRPLLDSSALRHTSPRTQDDGERQRDTTSLRQTSQ